MNIGNYFNEGEVELLKEYCLKANELCALTDEYINNKYPVVSFMYDLEDDDGEVYPTIATSLFVDYAAQRDIDPVEYYGDAFLKSDFMKLGENEEPIGNLYTAVEVDLLKRIFTIDSIIDDLDNGKKEYTRKLRYADGTVQEFKGYW